MNDLIPHVSYPLALAPTNPLAELARVNPNLAYDILSRQTDLAERQLYLQQYHSELSTAAGLAGQNAAAATEWLRNRQQDENGIDISSVASAGHETFFSGHRTSIRASMRIRIHKG